MTTSAFHPNQRKFLTHEMYNWDMKSIGFSDVERAISGNQTFSYNDLLTPISGLSNFVGSGAFGSVYCLQFNPPIKPEYQERLAYHLQSGYKLESKPIAAKIIRTTKSNRKWQKYTFEHETEALDTIQRKRNKYAHSLELYSYGWDNARMEGFLLMNMIPITTEMLFQQQINNAWEPRHIPISQIIKYACQLCAQVDHLHKAGFVHRDIDPTNILFENETDGALILIDYGLAEKLDLPEGEYVSAGKLCNYPPCTWTSRGSPEQAVKNADLKLRALLDPLSDAYAVGLTLLKLLHREFYFVTKGMTDDNAIPFIQKIVLHLQDIKGFETLSTFFPNSRATIRIHEDQQKLAAVEGAIWSLLRLTMSDSDRLLHEFGKPRSPLFKNVPKGEKGKMIHRSSVKAVYKKLKQMIST